MVFSPLISSFKENPHPDEKARLELGRRLGLESKQVKFWFQNRRTQMKVLIDLRLDLQFYVACRNFPYELWN